MKKLVTLLLCLLCLVGCGNKNEIAIKEVSKYGNIILDKTIEGMNELDVKVADIITVKIGDLEYEMPVGTSYSDVDNGKMICRFDSEDNEVGIAINSGNFAESTGLFTKETIEEDPGYKWTYNKKLKVEITVKEKQGYREEYDIRQLVRTNNREDYSGLSDEEYANFRAIKMDFLYRSSSPIDGDLGRNTYADEAMKRHNIVNVINLDDEANEMAEYEGYADTYYSTCNILNVVTDYDFTGETFQNVMKKIINFISDNEGAFLIHCKEGKDRTGIVCALLECEMGYSYDEIVEDYLETYCNYYGIEKGSGKYTLIANTNLNKVLNQLFEVEDVTQENLVKEVEEYFTAIGVTSNELEALKNKFNQYIHK